MMLKILPNTLTNLVSQLALGLMLLSLHAVLLWGFDSPTQKMLLLCHYGFFLVWQPIWQTKKNMSVTLALAFAGGGLLLTVFASWWLIAFWLSGLFGLLGGRALSTRTRGAKLNYLVATGYLVAILLLWVVPQLLANQATLSMMELLIKYVMPIAPLSILCIAFIFNNEESQASTLPPMLDFFYSLLLMLLVVIIVLGSYILGGYAIEASSKTSYGEVLLQVLFGSSLALVIISWLWNPHLGFSGIGQLLSRYLLSLGLPFEDWMKNIAELAEHEHDAHAFTEAAMLEINKLPWVSGLKWDCLDSHGELGKPTPNRIQIDSQGIALTLFSHQTLSPALTVHIKLLSQILGELYQAKRREEAMRQNTYMQAVYETGARLTHDIKNIVQSMGGLCSAAEQTAESDNDRLVALIRRQLPQLNQRLAMTLAKLQAPNQQNANHIPLAHWWADVQQRHAQTSVEFLPGPIPDIQIDEEVVGSVIDNLLQNAIEKAKHEPGISIQAEVNNSKQLCIEVCDSGNPMPQATAENLFKKHVKSENGLGIGLYHAAKQAEQAGYRLSLVENKVGEVRFRLSREA